MTKWKEYYEKFIFPWIRWFQNRLKPQYTEENIMDKPMLTSKTFWGVSSASVSGLVVAIPLALAGDETAIGAVVVIIFGWAGGVYGRYKAG